MTAAAVGSSPAGDWTVRPARRDDVDWLRKTLAGELAANSYFHGVHRAFIDDLAGLVVENGWKCLVVDTADAADQGDTPAGWVMFHQVPTLSIAMAYVDPSFRGLGAWRALRERIGLQPGQLVNVVLAGPAAMGIARKKYQAKHNWGRVLEWLA
jgi:GNAT superfamily N-acetyltransferase